MDFGVSLDCHLRVACRDCARELAPESVRSARKLASTIADDGSARIDVLADRACPFCGSKRAAITVSVKSPTKPS